MKKKLLILATLLIAAVGLSRADTTTSRLSLTKPSIGSTGWGTKWNSNADLLDAGVYTLSGTNTDASTTTHTGGHTWSGSNTVTGTKTDSSTTTLTGAVINGTGVDNSSTTYTGRQGFRNGISVSTPGSSGTLFSVGTSSVQAKGITDGSSAAAGDWGEYKSSSTAGNFVNIATGAWTNIVSITLTAGEWDVTGVIFFSLNSGAITRTNFAVSAFSGATLTDQLAGDNQGETCLPAGNNCMGSIPNWRANIAASGTYFLKTLVAGSATPQSVAGRISARRVSR